MYSFVPITTISLKTTSCFLIKKKKQNWQMLMFVKKRKIKKGSLVIKKAELFEMSSRCTAAITGLRINITIKST
jgi:hypothetical protein